MCHVEAKNICTEQAAMASSYPVGAEHCVIACSGPAQSVLWKDLLGTTVLWMDCIHRTLLQHHCG
jgi:hypothetical protein